MKLPGFASFSVVVVSGWLCLPIEASAFTTNHPGQSASQSNHGMRWLNSHWFDTLVSGRNKPGHPVFGTGPFQQGPTHQHGTPHRRLPVIAENNGGSDGDDSSPDSNLFDDNSDDDENDYTPGEVGDDSPPLPPDNDNGDEGNGDPPNFGFQIDLDGGNDNRYPPPDTKPVPAPGAFLLALLGLPCVARICRRPKPTS